MSICKRFPYIIRVPTEHIGSNFDGFLEGACFILFVAHLIINCPQLGIYQGDFGSFNLDFSPPQKKSPKNTAMVF